MPPVSLDALIAAPAARFVLKISSSRRRKPRRLAASFSWIRPRRSGGTLSSSTELRPTELK